LAYFRILLYNVGVHDQVNFGYIFFNHKITPHIQNNVGDTPLHVALKHHCPADLITYLVKLEKNDFSLQNWNNEILLDIVKNKFSDDKYLHAQVVRDYLARELDT